MGSRPSADALAATLLDADARSMPVEPLTDAWPEMTTSDAYAVQAHGRELRLHMGERLVGRKVGLTSAAMQEMLGVDQPDFGFLTDRMMLPSGATIYAERLIAPRVEAEIAFRLVRPLAGDPTVEEVLAATGAVAPALEVIDSRIVDWRIRLADTIADNASSALVVLGEFVPLGDLDLAAVATSLEVSSPNGSNSVAGTGEAVLGHPALAVAWLAAALDEFAQEAIAAGEIVLPGAMARALPFVAGDTVRATFTELGAVKATIR
jgi:2-keto-4-pentenoate hydratase